MTNHLIKLENEIPYDIQDDNAVCDFHRKVWNSIQTAVAQLVALVKNFGYLERAEMSQVEIIEFDYNSWPTELKTCFDWFHNNNDYNNNYAAWLKQTYNLELVLLYRTYYKVHMQLSGAKEDLLFFKLKWS